MLSFWHLLKQKVTCPIPLGFYLKKLLKSPFCAWFYDWQHYIGSFLTLKVVFHAYTEQNRKAGLNEKNSFVAAGFELITFGSLTARASPPKFKPYNCNLSSLRLSYEEKCHDLEMAKMNIQELTVSLEERSVASMSEQELKVQSLAGWSEVSFYHTNCSSST